ncbi:hypothetical protein [Marinobacter antarcticus]|nr:hypothetical protein [Marinobacter antarcticus]
MNVIAYDPKPDAVFAALFNVSYMDMDGLLQQSDIVTLSEVP